MNMTSQYNLVPHDDVILKEIMPRFTGNPTDLREFAFSMFKVMENGNGVGIAAPQVGLRLRMMIVRSQHGYSFRDSFVCINPEVVSLSSDTEIANEGCLSFPHQVVPVRRHLGVVMKYTDLKGREQTKFFFGALARTALHEFDHLEGIVMTDYTQGVLPI